MYLHCEKDAKRSLLYQYLLKPLLNVINQAGVGFRIRLFIPLVLLFLTSVEMFYLKYERTAIFTPEN